MQAAKKDEKKNLGRGLAALLGEESQDYAELDKARQMKVVSIDQLVPSPFQPRREFKKEHLETLSHSIKEKGVLQPLVVRRKKEDKNVYEIIAGERRWRASQMAELHEVPVVVKDMTDEEALHIALIENLQRQDLNPLEEARAFQRLMREFNHTQEAVAQAVSRSRSHVANSLRLLNLPQSVQLLISEGKLSAGHARTLVSSDFPEVLAQQIIDRNLSVREAERLTQAARQMAPKAANHNQKDPDIVNLERDLSAKLGMKVNIQFRGKAGTITFHYSDLDQLDSIIGNLKPSASVA